MARIPYEGETTTRLKPLSPPAFQTTATVENLERGEMELAEMFKVPADKFQKFIEEKQNHLDLTKVQNAKSAWQENEFERLRWIQDHTGEKSEGMLERETEYWDNYGNPLKLYQIGDVRVGAPGPTGIAVSTHGFEAAKFGVEEVERRNRMHKLHGEFLAQYNKLDDRQKLAVDQSLADRRPAYLHRIGVFEDTERRKATVQANEKAIGWANVESIQLGGSSTEAGAKKMTEGENTIKANAKIFGEAKETTEIKIQKFRSVVHEGVIKSFLNSPTDEISNLEKAEKYFGKHEGEITLAGKTSLNNALWAHNVAIKSSDLAITISQMPDDEKFDAISKIPEDSIREAVYRLVRQLDNIARKAKRKAKEEAATQIYDHIKETGGKDPNGKPLVLSNLPIGNDGENVGLRDAFALLGIPEKEQLQSILDGEITGEKPVSEEEDIKNSEKLMRLSVTNKAEFLNINIAKDYYGKMTKKSISFFQNLRRITIIDDEKGENSVVSWMQQIDNRLNGLGWSGEDYVRHMGSARTKIIRRIIEHRKHSNTEEAKRKNPTDGEVDGYINEILTPAYVESLNKKYKPVPADLPDEFSNEQQINAFILNQRWDKKDLIRIGAFKGGVHAAAIKFAETTGRNPGQGDIQRIINVVGKDKVKVEGAGHWYDPRDWFGKDAITDKEILYHQHELDPEAYPKDKLYVTVKDFSYYPGAGTGKPRLPTVAKGGKVYLKKHLGQMGQAERKKLGRWLEDNRLPETHENQAIWWRAKHPEVVLSEEMINEDGLIHNPDGGKGMKYADLESIINKYGDPNLPPKERAQNMKSLKAIRIDIRKRGGATALLIYDQLLKEHVAELEAGK